MNEEEKKAIQWLKNATFFSARIYAPSILNLIEKQRKEIEALKKGNKSLMDSRKKWKDRYYKQRYINYKQEKEIEKQKYLYEKLLCGYNERVKEIEELEKEKEHWKDETASFLNKCFEKDKEIKELKKENFDTVYIQAIENYKAKIRAKIKELEENYSEFSEYPIGKSIEILQELLEE